MSLTCFCSCGRASPPLLDSMSAKTIQRTEEISFIDVAGGSNWMGRETQIEELCLEYKLCPRLNVFPDTDLRSDLSLKEPHGVHDGL